MEERTESKECDCLDCGIRRVRCDRGMPACGTCLQEGRSQCRYDWTYGTQIFRLFRRGFDVTSRLDAVQRSRDLVGRGAFANVYKTLLDKHTAVAVKVLSVHNPDVSDPARALQMILREAWAWSLLSHRNVVPLLGLARFDELCLGESPQLCLVSAWMEAGNVVSYLQRNPSCDRLAIVEDISKAVVYLHGLQPQVVHGDIRGSNVLIQQRDGRFEAQLTDFGLSYVIDMAGFKSLSTATSYAGNPRWLARERMNPSAYSITSTEARSPHSDIFEMLRTFLEIFTSQPPFSGVDEYKVITMVMAGKPPDRPKDATHTGLSDQMWKLMIRGWDDKREKRPSALAVNQAVESEIQRVKGPSKSTFARLGRSQLVKVSSVRAFNNTGQLQRAHVTVSSAPTPAAIHGAQEPSLHEVPDSPLRHLSIDRDESALPLLPEYGEVMEAPGGSALQEACYAGRTAAVKLLLENGADIHVRGGTYGSALQAASYGGHEDVVELLLSRGADVNETGGYYGSALQAAARGGHDALVTRLLDHGAEINARAGYYGTALQAASRAGHEPTVKLLLEQNADVNGRGGFFGTALQAASYWGHEDVVRLLLVKGANANAKGGERGPPLHAASCAGHTTIMGLLVQAGADVNGGGGPPSRPPTPEGASWVDVDAATHVHGMLPPTPEAASGQSEGSASPTSAEPVTPSRRLTLRNPFVLRQVRRIASSPEEDEAAQKKERLAKELQEASAKGQQKKVRELLGREAPVNWQGGIHGTALQAASENGRELVARLLLDEGADVNAGGGKFGSALQAASAKGNTAMVELLISKKADVNALHEARNEGDYASALQAAAGGGHIAVVKLLLKAPDLQVDALGGYYGTALQAACAHGHLGIVKLLLDNGADVNVCGGFYGSALQVACHKSSEDNVRELLNRGADVNAQGGYYGNALQAACARGHDGIVLHLLGKGARVHATGGAYGTAWAAADKSGNASALMPLLNRFSLSQRSGLQT